MAAVIQFPGAFSFELSEAEVIREDVRDAVIDARAMHLNPALKEPLEDWNALGMSDPVSLPPLELEF